MPEWSKSPLESLSNPQVKRIVRLRSGNQRRKSGYFLIDGWKEITNAHRSGIALEAVYCGLNDMLPGDLVAISDACQPVAQRVLDKLSYGQRTAAPVAVAEIPERPLSNLNVTATDLVLVLDQTEKPGNLGACLRTAVACGVAAVVLVDPICDPFNSNAIHASRGALFSSPIAITTRQEFFPWIEQVGIPMWGARVDGSRSLWDCDFRSGAAIVVGNEADGLGGDWSERRLASFQIPMQNSVDSLNMSISAAVTLFEAVRQRGEI